jgi:hypothetical protein
MVARNVSRRMTPLTRPGMTVTVPYEIGDQVASR